VLANGWQTIPERGVVTVGHVNHLNSGGHQPHLQNGWSSQALSTYFAGECHKRLMVVGQLLIMPTVEICIQQLGRVDEMVSLPYDVIQNIYHVLSLCIARVSQLQRILL